jgi:hypothetical protein
VSGYDNRLNFGQIEHAIAEAAERAAYLGAEHVLGESTKIVPIEEGTLSRSGRAEAETEGDTAVGAVSYGTPYAVVQHERLDFRHDTGRQAKYLEQPLNAEAEKVKDIAAAQIREALK